MNLGVPSIQTHLNLDLVCAHGKGVTTELGPTGRA